MKKTAYSELWEQMNKLRDNGIAFSDILNILSIIIAAKLLSNHGKINSIFEANEILKEKYNVLADNEVIEGYEPELISTFINEINNYTFNNQLIDWLIDKCIDSNDRGILEFRHDKVKEITKIVKIPNNGVITDINAGLGSYIKEVIKNNGFKGKVVLFSTSIQSLRLSFINLYPINNDITSILSENIVDDLKKRNEKYDFIFYRPLFNTKHDTKIINEILDFNKKILNTNGKMILITSSNFLSNHKYSSSRSIILRNYYIDTIIKMKNMFKPYTLLESSMLYLINKVNNIRSSNITYIAEIDFDEHSSNDAESFYFGYTNEIEIKQYKNNLWHKQEKMAEIHNKLEQYNMKLVDNKISKEDRDNIEKIIFLLRDELNKIEIQISEIHTKINSLQSSMKNRCDINNDINDLISNKKHITNNKYVSFWGTGGFDNVGFNKKKAEIHNKLEQYNMKLVDNKISKEDRDNIEKKIQSLTEKLININNENIRYNSQLINNYLEINKLHNISILFNTIDSDKLKEDFDIRRFNPKIELLEKEILDKQDIVRLDDIFDIINSNSKYGIKDTVVQGNDTHKYIRVQDIKDGNIDIQKSLNVNKKNENEVLLEKDDILISVSGTIGRIGIIDHESEGSLFSKNIILLRKKNDNISPRFIYYMFQSKYFIAQLNNLIKGETVPRITIKQLRELKIPFISISKQKKLISEIILLSEELENIERKKKKIQYQLDNKLNEVFRKYEF